MNEWICDKTKLILVLILPPVLLSKTEECGIKLIAIRKR